MSDEQQPRPEPVRSAATMSAMLIALIQLLFVAAVSYGWIAADDGQVVLWKSIIALAINIGASGAAIWFPANRARAVVTPLASPQDNAGAPMGRIDGQPIVQ